VLRGGDMTPATRVSGDVSGLGGRVRVVGGDTNLRRLLKGRIFL